jgi:hypothetical protein
VKIFIILITYVSLQATAFASCEDAYKAYKKDTLKAPVKAPLISSTHVSQGMVSTSGALVNGAISTDSALITAGSANGIAFSYEGQFYLELMSSNIRHFRGRAKVLNILQQATVGLGEDLESLLDDLNDAFEEEIELFELLELINEANQENIFCPLNKELFTYKNLMNFVISLGP